MIPRPCLGVLMLFPIKDSSEEYSATEKAKIESDGQTVSENVYYMKQTVGNACGTVGILHSLLNAKNTIEFEPDSYLANFNNDTKTMNPNERAVFLENDEEIENTHGDAANEGNFFIYILNYLMLDYKLLFNIIYINIISPVIIFYYFIIRTNSS
jgi:ubiquitin carboxyl-terminal hydrolase L3